MYYLRAFPLDLSLLIQNFKVNTFLKVYRQAAFAQAYLISMGKLPMPMPYFPTLAQNQPLRPQVVCMTHLGLVLPTSILQYPLSLPTPKSQVQIAPQKPDIVVGPTNRIPSKEVISHKFPVTKVEQILKDEFEAAITARPKAMCGEMKLPFIGTSTSVPQLDSTPVKTVRAIKGGHLAMDYSHYLVPCEEKRVGLPKVKLKRSNRSSHLYK